MAKRAFTIVELIVVITIVGILSTVGFVSYSQYSESSRDSSRISQLKKLSDTLQVYSVDTSLPIPDNYIEISSSTGALLGYQGYIGDDVLETIDYTNGGKDPKDKEAYVYMLSSDRKLIQLGGYLESSETTNAKILPNDRILKSYGSKVGIFLDTQSGKPIQDVYTSGTFDLLSSTSNVTINFSDSETLTASGYALYALAETRRFGKAPSDCEPGFIGVPGNAEFQQEGFCVAQFEMTYQDANTPNTSVHGSDSNSVAYVRDKQLISKSGKYPIAEISQESAIRECKNMGDGYHLINNREWMTIARNIESVGVNWSSGDPGQGFIYNGVSNDVTLGCNATGGNTESRPRGTKTGPGSDVGCNNRRGLQLSNGKTIWDFSGNLWEHVNKDNSESGDGYASGQTAIASATPSNTWDADGIYDQTDMRLYGSAYGLGKAAGMGTVVTGQGAANNNFLRGATAYDTSNTGIYSLDLNRYAFSDSNPTDIYGFLGFRCAR